MKKILLILFTILISFSFPQNSFSQRRHSSTHKTSSSKPKTVHVRSYTTKKGTHVAAHYRTKSYSRRRK